MADNVVPIRPEKPEPNREVIREDLEIARGMLTEAHAHAAEGNDSTLTATVARAKDYTDLAWTMAGGRE